MAKFIIGKKLGMTTIYDKEAGALNVTLIECEPNKVSHLRTSEKDGYDAIQLEVSKTKNKLYKKEFRIGEATGLLVSGFSATTPEREKAEDGGYKLSNIPADAESIVYWVELFGVLKNDYLSVELYGPNRQKLGNNKRIMSQNKAVVLSSTGKRRGAAPWPKGTYSALLRLVRNGKLIVEEKRDITVMY